MCAANVSTPDIIDITNSSVGSGTSFHSETYCISLVSVGVGVWFWTSSGTQLMVVQTHVPQQLTHAHTHTHTHTCTHTHTHAHTETGPQLKSQTVHSAPVKIEDSASDSFGMVVKTVVFCFSKCRETGLLD